MTRCAVLGSPIDHSLSPALHTAAYRALGLTDWSYDRHDVGGPNGPDLATFLAGEGTAYHAFSVTMPLKEPALTLATQVSDHARAVGAVNTLVRTPTGWAGDSTDKAGVLGALADAAMGHVERAVILGAGATARSVVAALSEIGCRRVTFVVRDRVRPQTLQVAQAAGLRHDAVRFDSIRAIGEADVLIGTLPTGTAPDLSALRPPPIVVDCTYGGWPTPLARWAQLGGARVISGLHMLVHQAAAQVELMTGQAAPVDAMWAAVAGTAADTR